MLIYSQIIITCRINVPNRQVWILTCGISAATVLTFGISCACRRLIKRYKLKSVDISSEPVNLGEILEQVSSDSLATDCGYEYIDDGDLERYYSGLDKSNTDPPCYPVRGHYEGMGKQDAERCSTLSSISETIFGNLFDADDDKHYESPLPYEYTLRYLTPDVPCTSNADLPLRERKAI